MYMTIKEIASDLNTNPDTIRVWLGSYRFDKYVDKTTKPLRYNVNNDFLEELDNFLSNKKSNVSVRLKQKIAQLTDERKIIKKLSELIRLGYVIRGNDDKYRLTDKGLKFVEENKEIG